MIVCLTYKHTKPRALLLILNNKDVMFHGRDTKTEVTVAFENHDVFVLGSWLNYSLA